VTPDQLLTRFLLALCIWREARGESYRGKLLVGATIRNRVEDRRWPNTYAGVITQRMQFSAFNLGDPNALKFPIEGDPAWGDAVLAADETLRAETLLTNANHYHTKAVTPVWSRADAMVDVEGEHVFFRL
jgi:spore germination cell wall hydrolase CwlJ-like protein